MSLGVAFLSSSLNPNYWIYIILIIVYVGGVLVLFIYVTSVLPIKKTLIRIRMLVPSLFFLGGLFKSFYPIKVTPGPDRVGYLFFLWRGELCFFIFFLLLSIILVLLFLRFKLIRYSAALRKICCDGRLVHKV